MCISGWLPTDYEAQAVFEQATPSLSRNFKKWHCKDVPPYLATKKPSRFHVCSAQCINVGLYFTCVGHKHTCEHTCMWWPKADLWCLFHVSLPYIFKQGLCLNSKLIFLAGLASQLGLSIFCLHLLRWRSEPQSSHSYHNHFVADQS